MNKKLILLAMSLMLAASGALASDVFFFLNGKQLPVAGSADVHKIVPTGDGIETYDAAGAKLHSVSHSEYDYILFRSESNTGVDNVAATDGEITITVANQAITISATKPLQHIAIYDAAGRELTSCSPMSATATITATGQSKGVVVITATDGEHVASSKITLN